MKFRIKYILAILLLLTISNVVIAQTDKPNPKLVSPRSTVRYFLKIMNKVEYEKATRIDEAVQCLYLDDLPLESRSVTGQEIARKLFKVLYHFTFKVENMPDTTSQRNYTLPIGVDKGIDISLRYYDSGEWKFNYSKTLSRIDEYEKIINSEQEKIVLDTSVDATFRSPRETVRYFFSNMGKETDEGVAAAAEALDMSGFERSIRKDLAKERAMLLNSVLARSRYIDLVELSDDSKAAPLILLNDAIGRITIEKVPVEDTEISAWKFSCSSVKILPELYDNYREKEILDDINTIGELPLSIRVRDYMKKNFPALMKTSFLLENWQWIGLFAIVFVGLFCGRLVIYLLTNSIGALFKKANVNIDIETHRRFLLPISIAITAFIWWSGIYLLGLTGNARVILLVSVKVVAALASVWAGYRLVDVVGNYLIGKAEQTENKFDDLLAPLITKAMKVMVVICGLVFLADIFAIDIDKFMAGLGLGGLAFALAAKDTVSNIFGSVTILLDRPFQIGDWVTIGSADGTVEAVGIRSTRIRTFYDSLITIPNSELINAQIDNYGARTYRRINTTVGLAYDTPAEKVDAFCEGIRELIRNHPCTRKDYYIVSFDQFDAYSLKIMIYCFLRCPDWVAEKRETHRLFADVLRLAKRLGIQLAASTHWYRKEDELPVSFNVPEQESEAKAEGIKIADEIMREAGIMKDIKKNA